MKKKVLAFLLSTCIIVSITGVVANASTHNSKATKTTISKMYKISDPGEPEPS